MARYRLYAVFAFVLVGANLNLLASKVVDPVVKDVALNTASFKEDLQKSVKLSSATAGTKPKISIKKGDYELTLDGALKIENYFDDNSYMLNKNIPDENEYFKETVDLNFDFSYGEEKYGFEAVEAYLAIRHKGIWGKTLSFADRDSGVSTPSEIKLDETMFGGHSHYTSRAVLWFREAWLKVALNPIFGSKSGNYLQQLQLGWFPFQLGRGIALGSGYGFNEQFLGIYSYGGEDKSAPGIDLFGEVVKDTLWYSLYYAKFEETGKSLSDELKPIKYNYQGRKNSPWRGVAKNNELVAAQLKWVALNDDKFGKLDIEPYVMCDFASDQWVEVYPDTNTTLGAYGLGVEHVYHDFEWGSEVAFNFGSERLKSIDRNASKIGRDDDGYLYENYSHIYSDKTGTDPKKWVKARVNAASKKAYAVDFGPGTGNDNNKTIPGYPAYTNADDRFRSAYKNEFKGWMAVMDAAYNLRKWNLKLALSWSYASGDVDPHRDPKNKNYNGFIGLHEGYYGKRVPSIFIMDQRFLMRPLALAYPQTSTTIDAETDISFTNIQMYGAGLTWVPKYSENRTVSINPNVIGFWATKSSHKIDYVVGADNKKVAIVSPNMARDYMGTELNIWIKSEILKDLTLFGKLAAFFPGGYFQDIKGIPLDNDYFNKLAIPADNYDPRDYRLGADTAYHMNIGLEFKF